MKKGTYAEINKLKSKVNKIVTSTERKFVGTSFNGTAIAYDVNNVTAMCVPTVGDGDNNRTGSKITPTWLEGNFTLVGGSSATVPCTVRVTMVRAKQRFVPNSTTSSGTACIYDYGGTVTAPFSLFQWENRTHFTLMYDKLFTIGPYTATDPSGTVSNRVIRIKKAIKRPNIEFDGTTTTAQSGQIYLIFTSNLTAATGPPTISGEFRVSYTDL